MIERYENEEVARIWSDENKLRLWLYTELAVIEARVKLGRVEREIFENIAKLLREAPIDIIWWKERDGKIKHDLNAFLEERLRFLPPELQIYFHQGLTSYDTEEPPFACMLIESVAIVQKHLREVADILKEMALKYRFTPMNARTHGQEAVPQTQGKRCLTWLADIRFDINNLSKAEKFIRYSKLSGVVGNYGVLDPQIEALALEMMGLTPFYGATQIMPREIYAPLAQALAQIVCTLDKIATTIRLGARSGRPIYQEPFGKKQKGSSAMPHKKNTISTEQLEGMARMAKKLSEMIMDNIKTWEERAIEQSCVERIAWPDLFHIVVHSLKTMAKVLGGLKVFPDNMLLEIVDSRGCYASEEAKEVLAKLGLSFGLTKENAYRIVQLAAFNVFEPSSKIAELRTEIPLSLEEADIAFATASTIQRDAPSSIKDIILEGKIRTSPQLEATEEDVQKWNDILKKIFSDPTSATMWRQIFLPSHQLKNEDELFKKIIEV